MVGKANDFKEIVSENKKSIDKILDSAKDKEAKDNVKKKADYRNYFFFVADKGSCS